jgi:uncharacterized YigZ family protein
MSLFYDCMEDTYLTIETVAEGLYKDKGSKFIAFAHPVSTEEQVKQIIADYRKQYFDARHHCYAFMLGAAHSHFRASDDGEPSGTAGRPILGQIQSKQLTDIMVVVIRYFGGILLGTSGLIQAYKAATADALANAKIVERIVQQRYEAVFPYELMNEVMRVLKDDALSFDAPGYNNGCCIKFGVRKAKALTVVDKLSKIEGISLTELS